MPDSGVKHRRGEAPDSPDIDLAVVGGGASGLAGAVAGGRLGLRVSVLEKTDRCGHKLVLAGGRRCNFTHEDPPVEMAAKFDAGRRLVPLLRRFPYQRVIGFFAGLGIPSRTDADGCVWPRGIDGAAVRDRLVNGVYETGGRIEAGARVLGIEPAEKGWRVRLAERTVLCRNLCLATGGTSFPQTGSTGDGRGLLAGLGLETTPWFPVLCSLRTADDLSALSGITQQKVAIELVVGTESVRRATGHFIFAHQYVSGSTVLNLSGYAARTLATGNRAALRVDWVPDTSSSELAGAFAEARKDHPKQQVVTFLARYVARRLGQLVCAKAGVFHGRLMSELSRQEERQVAAKLKATEFEVTGTEPIERATVTGGGLSLDEVDIESCRVKRFPGLYVTGELLDIWAETGGYNLHFAWATGIAAAEAIAGKELK